MEFTRCCICHALEAVPPEMLDAVKRGEPVVCDRPECQERARLLGWSLLLEQFIETKRGENGEMLFRLKRDAG